MTNDARGLACAFTLALFAYGAVLLACAALVVAVAGSAGTDVLQSSAAASASKQADREIPRRFLVLYTRAAKRYGISWEVLAGIGKVECDNGRDPAPACWKRGSVNSAGAGGPMQFLAGTWAAYGVDADGDGRKDRWDPADAIYGAAHLLSASGAPQDYRRAIYSYNHAEWYVNDVLSWAHRYQRRAVPEPEPSREDTDSMALLQSQTDIPVRFVAGRRAILAPSDGHVALLPEQAPFAVQALLVAGNELQDLPYGPEGHPDPLGATAEDCSSTVNYVLYRAGIRSLAEILRDNPLAQNYVTWGRPGPGRWVTIYAADLPTPHVFIVIAGLRLDTSHTGTDAGPNRNENGPRWRISRALPAWARWSVRHPAGL